MYHAVSRRSEKDGKRDDKESDEDEEIDIMSNDENSRLSQETTASACSSSQGVSTEEDFSSNSNSAMDLSVSSQASCSSFVRPSLPSSASLSKLNRKRSKTGSTLSADENESEDGGEGPSRKEKSLGLLCKKFLAAMGEEAQSGKDVHLESVAKKMMVEKRRIYDIVNVMEALEAMSKTNKSYYRWHGLNELPQLMAFLQQQANEENLLSRIRRVEQAMCSFTELSSGSRRLSGDIVGTLVTSKSSSPLSKGAYSTSEAGESETSSAATVSTARAARDRNNKNSLAQLCRRFLMVLLCNPKDVRRVSLDVASTVLIKDPESEGFEPPSRSRCRRLYDIANVLVAMGIVKKVHYLFGTKKIPLFVYSGPEPEGSKSASAEATRDVSKTSSSWVLKNTLNTSVNSVQQGEVPNKRVAYVDLRRSFSGPQESKTHFRRQKSDLDILAVASEQRRQEYVGAEKAASKSLSAETNDENIDPQSNPVKVIRTSSGAIILKPEPKKVSGYEVLEPKLMCSSTSEVEKKYILKPACQNLHFFDPGQPHAFQKIEQLAARNQSSFSPAPLMTNFNLHHDVRYPSFSVPPSYSSVDSFASAYSVSALLAGPFTRSADRAISSCSVLQPRKTEAVTLKQRSILGDISQNIRSNK